MKRKSYFVLTVFLILIFFYSCINFIRTRNTGIWFYTFSSKGMSSDYNLTPASFICLQPDNHYTLDFGSFEYGKWSRRGDTLILNNASGNTEAFLIEHKSGKDLRLNIEPGVVCNFEAQPYSFAGDAATPFAFENNKWRIKATHKESAAEIQLRLLSHCRFWKNYFTWAFNNNLNTIDVRSTPTPIKIYGNGFAVKAFNDLPNAWKSYFYDSADCRLANDMLKNIFTHNDIAWAHTDNKFKMFIGAFEQLEQILAVKLSNQ